jgi:hypothetical protein
MSGLGPIPSTAIIALCEVYGATLEDFEKVLLIESLRYKELTAKKKKEPKDPEKIPGLAKRRKKK